MHQKLFLAIALCIASSAIATKLPGTLIVGGEEVTKNQYPYLVRFWVQDRFCAGTLISLDLVLTSASCVENVEGEFYVTAGDHSLPQLDLTEQSLTSQQVILHENFNNTGHHDNNIALIKLSESFKETEAVRTISLPAAELNPDDSVYGLALGWGPTTLDGNNSDTVHRAHVNIFNSSQCADFLPVELGNGHFCTLDIKGGLAGDNGGPLICNVQLLAVCGIMSSSTSEVGSESNQILGLYTNVPAYLDWIAANTPVDPTRTTPEGTSTTGPTESTTAGTARLAAVLLLTFASALFLLC